MLPEDLDRDEEHRDRNVERIGKPQDRRQRDVHLARFDALQMPNVEGGQRGSALPRHVQGIACGLDGSPEPRSKRSKPLGFPCFAGRSLLCFPDSGHGFKVDCPGASEQGSQALHHVLDSLQDRGWSMSGQPDDPVVLKALARRGEVLRSKWRIDSLIGVGGMASVFAATHRNGNRVAIKMLHPHLSADTVVRDRFLREGYVANAVGHVGSVRVLDDDTTDDGAVFLVMELLDGQTLGAMWEAAGRRLDVAHVLWSTDGLLDVLAAAHEKGIVHRDVKPENVFVTVDGVVKVLDFGIARLRDFSSAATATRAGSMLGTPAFMPPEQALGRMDDVDGRSDLWAVGATMFSLLTGRLVHLGETANELLVAAATRQAPQILLVMPELPLDLAMIIDAALAYDKANRWPDARSMQEALRAFSAGVPGGVIALHASPSMPPTATIAASPPEFGSGFGSAHGFASGAGFTSSHTGGSGTVSAPGFAPPGIVSSPGFASSPGATAFMESGSHPAMAPGGAPGQTVAFAPGQLVPPFDPASATTGSGAAVRRGIDGHEHPKRVQWIAAGLAVSVAALVVIAGAAFVLRGGGSPESDDVPITLPAASGSVSAVDSAVATHPPATSATPSSQPSPAAAAALGAVSVTSSGTPCGVQIAGKWLGQTPVQNTEVPVGEHTITCTPSKGAALVKTVRVRAGETTKVLFVASVQPPPSKKDPMDSWK